MPLKPSGYNDETPTANPVALRVSWSVAVKIIRPTFKRDFIIDGVLVVWEMLIVSASIRPHAN
jgi:hypothetical protein